ncbi:MAG TPA: alginate lyase family protein [Gaiellaceae bacterium]|nr:alginate lyase family protein [Gaiellaceae bacterium]
MSATSTRPRVFCVIADEHRDVAVAEDACAGRFTHCGVTLDLGRVPDWSSAGLVDDPEWRVECSKFLWALDLAHAHATTGERRFCDAWERLARSWIEQVPPRSDATEVAARRLQNWVYAREAFGPSASLDGLLLARLRDEVDYVREHLTHARNHRTLELYGLLVAALGVAEVDEDGSLAEFALAQLEANLEADFHPDGVHCEQSTHYHALVVRSHLAALENAQRFGLPVGPEYEARLARACEFLRHVRRPDGGLPQLSDSDGADPAKLLALGARLLRRPDLHPASAPARRNVSFPDGGYFVQRSGWDRNARFLVFDCGPVGDGGHGHYDALSIEVAANGRPLIVDPGRYTYAVGEPDLRHRFKSTAAHTTVTVDGRDQTPYSRGRPKGPVAAARAGMRTRTARLDVLRGEARSPSYEAVHARTILFVDDAWWLVQDRLTGEITHEYDLRFQLASPDAYVVGSRVVAPGLVLEIAGSDGITLETGWVAPSYGVRLPTAVVSARHSGRDALFTTIVAPVHATHVAPRLASWDVGRADVVVGGRTETFAWTELA